MRVSCAFILFAVLIVEQSECAPISSSNVVSHLADLAQPALNSTPIKEEVSNGDIFHDDLLAPLNSSLAKRDSLASTSNVAGLTNVASGISSIGSIVNVEPLTPLSTLPAADLDSVGTFTRAHNAKRAWGNFGNGIPMVGSMPSLSSFGSGIPTGSLSNPTQGLIGSTDGLNSLTGGLPMMNSISGLSPSSPFTLIPAVSKRSLGNLSTVEDTPTLKNLPSQSSGLLSLISPVDTVTGLPSSAALSGGSPVTNSPLLTPRGLGNLPLIGDASSSATTPVDALTGKSGSVGDLTSDTSGVSTLSGLSAISALLV